MSTNHRHLSSVKADDIAVTKIPITVVVPTKNEELAIVDCLAGLTPFDQVIVVDSMSTDETCALAKAAGAEVVSWQWDGRYPKKHQWCLDNLEFRNDWTLFLDADERCSPELIEELERNSSVLLNGRTKAYDISLLYVFAGRALRHGHKVVKRTLFDRTATSYPEVDDTKAPGMGEQEGHYQPQIDGGVGVLDSQIIHDDPDPVGQWVSRHNRYSDWEAWLRANPSAMAQVRSLRSKQGQLFDKAPFKPLLFFIYSYVVRSGWRDGRAGFEYAYALSFYYWLIGVKTREMSVNTSKQKMEVVHLVTRDAGGGASGGPIAVAKILGQELGLRHKTMRLYAGWDGLAEQHPDITTKFFRTVYLQRINFTILSSPALLFRLWREARKIDIAHIHLSRDLVTMPAALVLLARKVPLVVQTHGMITPDTRLSARFLDAVFTRRILRGAAIHLCLTATEERETLAVAPGRSNARRLTNGVSGFPFRAQWSTKPEVLFCARLHPRKRVSAFIEMARQLVAEGSTANFTVIGPDEGDLAIVRQACARPEFNGQLSYEGSAEPSKVVERISRAQVFVLPSVDEPFPVTVLEAMGVGVPTVITKSNGIAPILSNHIPGAVTDGSPMALAAAVNKILSSRSSWESLSKNSSELVSDEFSLNAVVDHLLSFYDEAQVNS